MSYLSENGAMDPCQPTRPDVTRLTARGLSPLLGVCGERLLGLIRACIVVTWMLLAFQIASWAIMGLQLFGHTIKDGNFDLGNGHRIAAAIPLMLHIAGGLALLVLNVAAAFHRRFELFYWFPIPVAAINLFGIFMALGQLEEIHYWATFVETGG